MEVYKFGGASVKDAPGVINLAAIVAGQPQKELLIVVSAMGKITNKLEELTHAYLQQQDHTMQLLEEVKDFHFHILMLQHTFLFQRITIN